MNKTEFEKYLVPADRTKRRCVDERHATDQTAGPQIQGATSGEVDALKQIRHLSEEAAWKAMKDAGIPIDGHIDSNHGPNGCGYNNRVETDPSSVGASEQVTASSRLRRVEDAHGTILHYTGDHNPAYATINYVHGTTLDTNQILGAGKGTFNLDAWILAEDAEKLGLHGDEMAEFIKLVVGSYKKTIGTLTNNKISTFTELRKP